MPTYPRFAKACYALFAVAVVAAALKLSISGDEPPLLKLLPSSASAVERAPTPAEGLVDPRLEGFSEDGAAERIQASFDVRSAAGDTTDGTDASVADPPVFRRPSLEGDVSEPVCGDLGDAPRSSRVVFPLPEEYFNSYGDTWGAARPQGGHEGSDLMSAEGTPEFALTDGKLVAVAGSNENGWNRLGGYTVMLEAAYGVGPIKKGDLFYYAHLDRESSLPIGTEVRAGQRIGTVGDTGEGPEVTRGKFPPHLHFGWYDADLSEARSEAESGAINPYPLLRWLEENGGAVSGGTDASYCEAPQGPIPAPSTGEPAWPTPSAPGERPDLDTGSAAASPAARHGEKRRKHHKQAHTRTHKHAPEAKSADDTHETGAGKGPKKLSLHQNLEARADALRPHLPAAGPDRTVPEAGEQEDHGRNDADGNDKGQGSRATERPENGARPSTEDRPEKTTPEAAPNPKPRPVPDRPAAEPDGVVEKAPEAPAPEDPVHKEGEPAKPAAPPDAGIDEAAGGAEAEGTVPSTDELPGPVEAEPAAEPAGGE